jgi:hypothetical protein
VILDGTYYELSDFLYRLRNLVEVHVGRLASQGRLFTVGKISIVEGEKHFPELEATMTINAFVYGSGPAGEDDAGSATTDTTSTSTDTTSTDTTSTTTTPAPTGAASEGASAAGIAR